MNPHSDKSLGSFLGQDFPATAENRRISFRIDLGIRKEGYLLTTLDDIERTDDGVCDAAGEDTSHHAFHVVVHIVFYGLSTHG